MHVSNWLRVGFAVCLAPLLALTACGGDSGGTGGAGGTGSSSSTSGSTSSSTSSGGSVGDPQTPPQGETAIKAWLATGDYKKWHCEDAEHDARSPSPHGVNRICSNDILSSNPAGATYKAKSAAVKELWDMKGGKVIGYAVYLKLQDDSAGGAGWYYYEDNPTINPPGGVVADGVGTSGNPKTVCVACHMAAGMDAMHSGHDYVYTQVQ